LVAVIKTQIYKRNPNLNLWKSSIEQRLGLKEAKSVSYKSEEQTWHVRFPWEDKKEEDPIEDLSHSLD
ncbi:MAG: hypothetical protein GWP59_01355, partial [Chlamydiales bacterium]|nr:hypothetical protein [Chlamydiales bacterium]